MEAEQVNRELLEACKMALQLISHHAEYFEEDGQHGMSDGCDPVAMRLAKAIRNAEPPLVGVTPESFQRAAEDDAGDELEVRERPARFDQE